MTPEELRERRTALGLTQEQLGEIIGKPRNTITRWESGSLAIRDQALLSLALEALERRPRVATSEDGSLRTQIEQAIVRYGAAWQIVTDAEHANNPTAMESAARNAKQRKEELWALLDLISWAERGPEAPGIEKASAWTSGSTSAERS